MSRRQTTRPTLHTLATCFMAAMALPATLFAQQGQPRRVHALMVIDRAARVAGLTHDSKNMHATLSAAVGDAPARGSLQVMNHNVSRTTILAAINSWRDVGPDDVVVFYYSGHGATHTEGGHLLATSSKPHLARSTLRRHMLKHNPRLAVILTDCCSNTYPGPSAQAGGAAAADPIGDLFHRHRGLVDISAATYTPRNREGESAWCHKDTGGVFTDAFAQLIRSGRCDVDGDGFASWNELMVVLQRDTMIGYRALKKKLLANPKLHPRARALLYKQANQTPQAFSLALADVGSDRGEHFAGNLGVFVRMTSLTSGGRGAELTRAPLIGSPTWEKEFERGDIIVGLDDTSGYRLRDPLDLQLHRLKTKVRFINVRNGRYGVTTLDLGPWMVPDFKATNLGACYVLRPHGNHYGVHITRKPKPGSPLAKIEIEPGDIIVEMDGQPIRSHWDVLSHHSRTTMKIVNVRNGRIVSDVAQLSPKRGDLIGPNDFLPNDPK